MRKGTKDFLKWLGAIWFSICLLISIQYFNEGRGGYDFGFGSFSFEFYQAIWWLLLGLCGLLVAIAGMCAPKD